MAKLFYLRLAAGNLFRNRRMYGPYCVAATLMSAITFIILNLVFSDGVRNLPTGQVLTTMFTFGIVVMTLFTIGYMLYINSFLIKRRKKEFGLYAVLGMERRHVARVILWENALVSFGSLLLGLVCGLVFGRLVFMLLVRMLAEQAGGSAFLLSGAAMLLTALIFLAIFILTTLYNLNQVRLSSPVDLMRDARRGERKPRLVAPATLLGAVMLGLAYYIAITVRQSAVALMLFWPAVILVIIATWLLFTGGSVFILNLLCKSRRIYYKPRNFITLSGLRYRMKQNAAGLANICILSTMVMVTVACCCALYLGREEIVRTQHPNDITFTLSLAGDAGAEANETNIMEDFQREALAAARREGIEVESQALYRGTRAFVLERFGDAMGDSVIDPELSLAESLEAMTMTYSARAVPLSEYNQLMGTSLALEGDEALLLSNDDLGGVESLSLWGGTFRVAGVEADTPFTAGKNGARRAYLALVIPDGALEMDLATTLTLNLGADQAKGFAYEAAMRDAFAVQARAEIGEGGSYNADGIFSSREEGNGLYGGLLFLGAFFALLFLTNTVLIIYFKQISEGFDDCERFKIMQKVGLSDQEVRGTVNRQMLIVFLLPLLAALAHILAAGNMIQQMLGTFALTNFALTARCILVTCAVFAAAYLLVYRLTARTYYRLVRFER